MYVGLVGVQQYAGPYNQYSLTVFTESSKVCPEVCFQNEG